MIPQSICPVQKEVCLQDSLSHTPRWLLWQLRRRNALNQLEKFERKNSQDLAPRVVGGPDDGGTGTEDCEDERLLLPERSIYSSDYMKAN